MGRHTNTPKRLSTVSQSTSNNIIDLKARKRIEHLYELTDEIINAYNEINEKYVHHIYRKYRQSQEIIKKLRMELANQQCSRCKCKKTSNENVHSDDDEENEQNQDSTQPSSTTKSTVTRRRSQNPFIISDIEDTQNFNANDSRFRKNLSDDEEDSGDKVSMDTNTNQQSSEESENDEADDTNGMSRLPLVLQNIIRRKARNRRNPKPYLLEIPRYPALCEYLRDKSTKSFDSRTTDVEIRPFVEQHISKILATDKKQRMRIRDELREIHRSYLRTFMNDPHKSTNPKAKLPVKKSPM